MSDPTGATTESVGAEAAARILDFEIEVDGTPEEVWDAIATGPGISSWYVPHTVEERTGGVASARFGPGEDMVVPGRVAQWEPPNRVLFDGGADDEGLAFAWTVEANTGDTCVVRLVNSGFTNGEEWDAMYDGLRDGWPMFLLNLQLHRRHFPGRYATAMLPTGSWAGPADRAWSSLLDGLGLGLPASPEPGDRIEVADGAPPLAGTVAEATGHRLAIILDDPAPGTAFLAVEGGFSPETVEVSIWSYLYGPDRDDLVARDQPRWAAWLAERSA